LLQKPDEGALSNLANVIPNMRLGAGGFGVGYFLYCDGLLFNTQTFPTSAPDSFSALWDEKYKGRLFLPPPQYTEAMELTVVAAKLAGGDERNPEPGFKKLEELRGRVVLLADNQAQVADLFRTNSLDIGGVYSPMLVSDFISKPEYNLSGTLRLKEGFFYDLQFMVIPKGHPGDDAVIHALINYALDPGVQSKMAEEVWYGPINQQTTLSEEAKNSPYVVSGETVAKQGITLDKEYLASVRQDWIQRYTEIFGT
jgi:putative spermidine/putrescine transport system substrate-binding protein